MNASGSFVPERTAIRIRAGRSLFLALFLAIVPIRIAAADWQGIAPPSGRHGGAAIYDSQRNRLVVYAGEEMSWGMRAGDAWGLSLGSPHAWSRIVATGGDFQTGRSGHTAIYDAAADRLIAFGSRDFSKIVSVLSFSGGSGAWSHVTPAVSANAPPPGLRFHAAIIDPMRNRMIISGGAGQTPVPDAVTRLWAVSLSDLSQWSEITPAGTAPLPRMGHVAIYDAPRDRMIVIGGAHGGSPMMDVWALSLSGTVQWTQLTPTGAAPVPRQEFVAVYDGAADRIVLFGGRDGGGGALNDLWSLSLSGTPAWSQLAAASAPSGRYRHTGAFDPTTRRLIVFGGADPNPRGDVWQITLGGPLQWTKLVDSNPPDLRFHVAAMYDSRRDRMLVFGGGDPSAHVPWNGTQQLPFSGAPLWSLLAVTGTTYSRNSAQAFDDHLRDRMIVVGTGQQFSDVRISALSLAGTPQWSEIDGLGGRPQSLVSPVAYDPRRDRCLVLANPGVNGPELWSLSFSFYAPPVWTHLSVALGPIHSGQSPMNLMLDPLRDRLIAFAQPTGSSQHHLWQIALEPLGTWADLGELPWASNEGTPSYDPVRDRILLRSLIGTWALDLASGTPTISEIDNLVPPQFTDNTYSEVSSFYDPSRDRLVTVGTFESVMEPWTLSWNQPAGVAVTCPDTVRGRGDAVPVRYHLSHTATGARAIHWHVRAKRNWPDPQRHGVQVVAAGAQAEIVVPMFIPDTAAAGAGALEMTAWFAGTPGNDATCSAAMATPTTSAESVDRAVGFALGRPRPQPARREAVIALTLPVAGAVRIDVLDVSGRRVQDTRTLKLAAGTHPIPIRAGAGGPSIYLVRATFAGETRDSRVVFLE